MWRRRSGFKKDPANNGYEGRTEILIETLPVLLRYFIVIGEGGLLAGAFYSMCLSSTNTSDKKRIRQDDFIS